jgi:tetratricopeptide (TPR) repeat protein
MISALLAIHLLAAGTADIVPVSPRVGQAARDAKLKACIEKTDSKPDEAFEDASIWASETHIREASICKAVALIALKRMAEGALLLEQLAEASDGGAPGERADLYSRAGNARLLDLDPDAATTDFTAALKYAPGEADVLIDRARAYALVADWRKAEEDLSAAADKRPNDPLILSLRAEARLQQGAFDLAEKDAEAALAIAPKDVNALLERGRVLDAKRTGKPPG